ncbi:MAG: hypothetical protein U1F35_10020 [Steroidobacteraceae bacterium]
MADAEKVPKSPADMRPPEYHWGANHQIIINGDEKASRSYLQAVNNRTSRLRSLDDRAVLTRCWCTP